MIRLDTVTFRYEDMVMSFDAVFERGSFTAVIGPSGAGKSTLLNLIAGFERPVSGRILIDGADMAGVAPGARPVNFIFQDNNVFAHLDIWNNVALGLSPGLKLDRAQRARVDDALAKVGLGDLAQRLPGAVSGGERQRVAIARALLRAKPVLLLDEPFAALGPALRLSMLDLMKDLQRQHGLTIVMVSHQPEDAQHAASHVAFLAAGRIVALKPTADFFASRDIPGLKEYLGGLES